MDATKCQELSAQIIEKVGGRENVEHVLHCATRLRFNLRDYDKANVDALRSLAGVVGCQQIQGQLQVIIGTEVGQVYDEVCRQGSFSAMAEVPEDGASRDRSPKGIALAVMDAISGCVNPILPIIIAAGMVKLVATILGPSFTGLITVESDLYRLLSFAGDAGFYFFPVYVGYAAAKKFNTSVPLARFWAASCFIPLGMRS